MPKNMNAQVTFENLQPMREQDAGNRYIHLWKTTILVISILKYASIVTILSGSGRLNGPFFHSHNFRQQTMDY